MSPSWNFFIDLPDLARGVAEVTWTLRGFGPERPLRVCGDMDGAERFVTRIERLLHLAEYKRRQAPPGVKLGSRNFGRDRRYPISHKFRTGA